LLAALTLVQLTRQARLDLRGEGGTPAGDGRDAVADLLPRRLLREIALRARGDRPVGEVAVEVGREQEDLGVRAVPPNGAQHLEAVQPRHPNVQEGYVGLQVADLIEGVAAVARLADQLEVGALADGPHHPVAVDRVVVGNEHPHPIRPPSAQASSWFTAGHGRHRVVLMPGSG